MSFEPTSRSSERIAVLHAAEMPGCHTWAFPRRRDGVRTRGGLGSVWLLRKAYAWPNEWG